MQKNYILLCLRMFVHMGYVDYICLVCWPKLNLNTIRPTMNLLLEDWFELSFQVVPKLAVPILHVESSLLYTWR